MDTTVYTWNHLLFTADIWVNPKMLANIEFLKEILYHITHISSKRLFR